MDAYSPPAGVGEGAAEVHYRMSMLANVHAVIPAGGAGTRLWPLSRRGHPKFLLDLTGTGRTLLQQTWDRLEPLLGAGNIHVVAGPAHAEAVAAQLPRMPSANLLVEPSPRDSMAAIGLAAAVIEQAHPGAIIGSFAADHVIGDDAAFAAAVTQAVAVAERDLICTIGISPDDPSTAFGYIEAGVPAGIEGAAEARMVKQFVEKPAFEVAVSYLATGTFWWNAGMFVMGAATLLNHLAELQPEMHAGLTTIAEAWDGDERDAALEAHWPNLTKIAIDHAVAEPLSAQGELAMIPGRFDWSDLGDFAALSDLAPHAANDVQFIDAYGFVVPAADRSISVLGIPGVIVVDTGDALLVTTREYAQRVKEIPAAWAARGRDDLV